MNRMRCKILVLIGLIILYISSNSWASIVLKTMVVNPSKTRVQKATLKAYLPKEVTPEDVIDMGDLKIDYDISESLYFVYKEFELAPGESVVRAIEIEDIWMISSTDINKLIEQIKDLVEKLQDTIYIDVADELEKKVEAKARKILEKQEEAMDAVPQQHIAAYRENIKRLELLKEDLAELNEMALKVKLAKAAGEGSGGGPERVSVKATWKLILGVIIALGLLSFVFFIIWQRQAGLSNIEGEEKELKTETTPPPPKPEPPKDS